MSNNKEIIEKVNTAFAENKLEDFYALCADDIEWTMPGEGVTKGIDAARELMKSVDCEHGTPNFDVSEIISEGDAAVCSGTMTMTENGIPKTYSFADIYRFRDGKIAALKSFVINEKETGEKAAASN